MRERGSGLPCFSCTVDGLSVKSRRGWQMRERVPELAGLPPGLVLDGELVAFQGSDPWFPDVCDRILHGRDIPIVYIVFDLLAQNGESLVRKPQHHSHAWQTSPRFEDGEALTAVVVERGWEGVVAKKLTGSYRPDQRDCVKVKNRAYWRFEQERELVSRSGSRSPFVAEAY